MGLHRYFLDKPLLVGKVSLPAEEAHHAIRVRREIPGNLCIVFDGHGNEATATVETTSKRDCELIVDEIVFAPRDLPSPLILGVALPKGDRLRAVIEKGVELGVTKLVPIICERSVKIPQDRASEKLKRLVVEACKQCERNQLMEIETPISFKTWIDSINQEVKTKSNSFRMLAHPDLPVHLQSMHSFVSMNLRDRPLCGWAAIGPEGGFTDAEALYAHAGGWTLLDLGSRILRVETAVASIATLASIVFDDHQDRVPLAKEMTL